MSLVFAADGSGALFKDGALLFDDGSGNACCCLVPCTHCDKAVYGIYVTITGWSNDDCTGCTDLNTTFYVPVDSSGACTGYLLLADAIDCDPALLDVEISWSITSFNNGNGTHDITLEIEIRVVSFAPIVARYNKTVTVNDGDRPIDCKDEFDGTIAYDSGTDPAGVDHCDPNTTSVDAVLDQAAA